MKKTLQKINIAFVSLAVAMLLLPATSIQAQDCSGYTDQNEGNLVGYIIASNLPSAGNNDRIYMSSTDDPWTGGISYGVSYDRDLEVFSGLAWNEEIGWIDFDYGTSNEADALEPDGSFEWGGWEGNIVGLDNVSYSNNSGGFLVSGSAPYDAQYVSGSAGGDVPVGMGELDFTNVQIDGTLTPPECEEYIDVLADGATSTNLSSCNGSVNLRWASNNIALGTCQTLSNGAPWNSPGSRSHENTSGETSGSITSTNTPAYFTIQCTGDISGNLIRGTASVRCEAPDDPGEGTGTSTGFKYKES